MRSTNSRNRRLDSAAAAAVGRVGKGAHQLAQPPCERMRAGEIEAAVAQEEPAFVLAAVDLENAGGVAEVKLPEHIEDRLLPEIPHPFAGRPVHGWRV